MPVGLGVGHTEKPRRALFLQCAIGVVVRSVQLFVAGCHYRRGHGEPVKGDAPYTQQVPGVVRLTNFISMSRWTVLVALAVGALVASVTGCSLLNLHKGKGEPVSMDMKADEPPKTPIPSSVEQALRQSLENRVLQHAAKSAPVTSECKNVSGRDYECTAVYAGQTVHSKMRVTQPPTGTTFSTFKFEVVEEENILTRHAVHVAIVNYAKNYYKGVGKVMENPRCDAGIPEAKVYKANTKTDHYCYANLPGKETKRLRVVALNGAFLQSD